MNAAPGQAMAHSCNGNGFVKTVISRRTAASGYNHIVSGGACPARMLW
jgi:hypothetical protein